MTQRDILLGLDQKVDTLIIQMATVVANAGTSDDTLRDHESRIRKLENYKARSMGVMAALTFALMILATASWHIWG